MAEVCTLFIPANNDFISNIGHINHSLFWTNLAPTNAGGGQLTTSGLLEKTLVRDFGSFEEFKKTFNATAGTIQGSGWGWLVRFLFSIFYEET